MENSVGMPPIGEAKKRMQIFRSFEAHRYHSIAPPAETLLIFFIPQSFLFEMSGSMGFYRSGAI